MTCRVKCCVLHFALLSHFVCLLGLGLSFLDYSFADCRHLCNFQFVFGKIKGRIHGILLIYPILVCDVLFFFIYFSLCAFILKHTVKSFDDYGAYNIYLTQNISQNREKMLVSLRVSYRPMYFSMLSVHQD